MNRRLALALTVTDLLFLTYWGVSALDALGLISVPADLLFAGHDEPRVVAWNWSFLPLDLAFSILGLSAVRAARAGLGVWRPLALMSLVCTMIAGGMAVAYWGLLGEFDPAWFLPNLALLIWPMAFLPGLVRDMSR
jgi:hypothetical protein